MLQITESVPAAIADRVLRCPITRHYWSNGQWSADPEAATVFSDTLAAIQACSSHHLKNIELVLRTRLSHIEVFSTALY